MGYSFAIITGGYRDDLLENLIQSIHRMKIPEYEIIVCGKYRKRSDIKYIHRPGWAAKAEVCKMRNLNCKTARYDNILILDDDLEFTPDWYQNIKDFTEFDMTGCKGVDTDGERWFDYNWASRTAPLIPTKMIPYDEYNDSVYISGYFMMFKRYVWEKVKFDESRKNYQFDDVNFCHRVTSAGFKISIFPNATVIHHFDQRGRKATVKARQEFEEKMLPPAEKLYRNGLESLRNNKPAEAVKLLKEAVSLKDNSLWNYNLGLAYQISENNQLAKKQYLKALKLHQGGEETNGLNISSLHLHLGEIYLQSKELNEAKQEFVKVLKFVPKHKKANEYISKIQKDKS